MERGEAREIMMGWERFRSQEVEVTSHDGGLLAMMEVSSYDGKSFSLSRFILLVKVPPHDNGFSSRNRKVSLELPKASRPRGMWRDGGEGGLWR